MGQTEGDEQFSLMGIMSILGLKNHNLNLFGLIIGVLLSSFWNESIFINEILLLNNSNNQQQQRPESDGSSSSSHINDEASRHLLQERLDTCSTKLSNIISTKRNIQKQQLESKTTAAICTTTFLKKTHQNSLYYIDEFVDYHLALGFESIYIYYYYYAGIIDDDDSLLMLKNWANSRNPNRVILNHLLLPAEVASGGDGGINVNNTNVHETVYKKCLDDQQLNNNDQVHDYSTTTTGKKLYKNDWLTYLDMNEFIVLKKNHSNIVDMLQDTAVTIQDDDDKAGLVSLSRFSFFGFNHTQLEYEPTPVLKRFQYRLKQQPDSSNVKITIAKTTTTTTNQKILLQEEEEPDYITKGHHRHQVNDVVNDVATDIAVIHHYYYYDDDETLSSSSSSSLQEGEEEEIITVFDDTAWKFLYTSVPLYGKYN